MPRLPLPLHRIRMTARKLLQLLPEPDYRSATIEQLVAQVGRVRVRCQTEGIAGWLTPRERQIIYAVARWSNGPLAEVGSWAGLSTCIICSAIRDSGINKEFVTHDLYPTLANFRPHGDGIGFFFPPESDQSMGDCTFELYERTIKPTLERPGGILGELRANLSRRGFSKMVKIVEGDFGVAEKRAYRFVFADVLHGPNEIAVNGPKVARLLGPGSVLLCHDSNDENESLLRQHIRFRKIGRVDSILVCVVTDSTTDSQ